MKTAALKSCCLMMAVLLTLMTCKEKEITSLPTAPLVNPPIPEFDSAYSNFEFDNTEGYTYRHPSGTQIVIPPNTFMLPDSLPATGKVNCSYREFHTASAVYLAGIPMTYMGGNFETAGSFDLKASQGDTPLQIAEDQQVKVKLASFESGEDYDFFYLDEAKRGWDKLGSREPEINEEALKLKRKISRMEPELSFPLDRRYIAFNYEALLDVYYGGSIPKDADREAPKERMADYGIGWMDVYNWQQIDWKGKKMPAALMVWKMLKRKSFPSWTEGYNTKLTLIKGNRYQLDIVSKDSSQYFDTELAAVMTLQELFAFPAEEWVSNYKATKLKVQREQERLELMAAVYREFEISQLGVYNWDRLLKMEESIQLQADFNFPVQLNEKLTAPEVVYISGDNRSVIKFPQSVWASINLLPQDGGRFFCLLPDKQLAVFGADKYAEVDFDNIRQMAQPGYVFNMQDGGTVASAADFRKKLMLP